MRFLFVDQILELTPGKSIEAEHVFSGEEDFFLDHFPGFPVVPGVLLTEMMAQTAGKCLDAESRESGRGKAMLARTARPLFGIGSGLAKHALVKAEIRTSQAEFATAACSVEVNGLRVCTAEFLFSFLPLEKFAPELPGRGLRKRSWPPANN